MRQRNRHVLEAAALPQIEMVERARADAHKRVARTGLRIRRLLVAENLRAAVLVEADRLHKEIK